MAIRIGLTALADYASVSQDGKLTIAGMFSSIAASNVPVHHPQLYVVVVLESEATDAGRQCPVGLELIDEDGASILQISGVLTPGAPPPGEPLRTNHIFQLNNIRLTRFGSYHFKVLISGEPRATIPLIVRQIRLNPPQN